jgi:hypothetical protein
VKNDKIGFVDFVAIKKRLPFTGQPLSKYNLKMLKQLLVIQGRRSI